MGRTSIAPPVRDSCSSCAMASAPSRLSASTTMTPARNSLVSMKGPSVKSVCSVAVSHGGGRAVRVQASPPGHVGPGEHVRGHSVDRSFVGSSAPVGKQYVLHNPSITGRYWFEQLTNRIGADGQHGGKKGLEEKVVRSRPRRGPLIVTTADPRPGRRPTATGTCTS